MFLGISSAAKQRPSKLRIIGIVEYWLVRTLGCVNISGVRAIR